MNKKTLDQYKREFESFPAPRERKSWNIENLEKYEKLANDCISDYPDEELGYTNLGIAIGVSMCIDRYERNMYYNILRLSESNYKYASTLENIIEYSGGELTWAIDKDYPPHDIAFKNVYVELGNYAIFSGYYQAAANIVYIAHDLGINYDSFNYNFNPPINKISIGKFLCLENIEITNISNTKEIYFLGENGVGKTLLLQTIIDTINQENRDSIVEMDGEYPGSVRSYQNFFAYGTARYRTGSSTDDSFDKTGYMTLFDRHKLLINPLNWFKEVLLRQDYKKSPLKIDTVISFFNEIMNFENSTDFKVIRNGMDFYFYEQDTLIEFEHLAEGYRTVLIWLSDLLSRLTQNQPYIEKLDDFYGIVLVDEIDLFLHPKWEYNIVKKLRQKLPNIQWIFTTHSPMLILGASEDAVFYRLYKEHGITKISEQWKCSDLSQLMASAIVTSPLFDMETARMSSYKPDEELDTSEYYLESLIGKKVAEMVAEKRKTQTYISRKETDDIIDAAIKRLIPKSVE